MTGSDGLLAATIREQSGRLVTALYRRFGDFDVAEEAVQGAVVEALTSWRRDGTPRQPAAWLTTAAQRNALDLLRSRGRQARAVERLAGPPADEHGARRGRPSRRGRTAAAAVRVLPPRAGAGGAARADPARRHRSDHAPDRAGVPRQRADPRAADRPGQAQDRRRGHRAQGARGSGRAAAGRARRRLPRLQRSVRLLHGEHPRPRPRSRHGLARRGRRPQPARAAPRRGAWRRCCGSSTARAAARFTATGDLVLLRDQDRSLLGRVRHQARRRAPRARRLAPLPRPLPAPGRDRHVSRRGAVVGGDRLAADRHVVRRPRPRGSVARGPPQRCDRARPARSPAGRRGARRRRDPRARAGRLPPLARRPGRAVATERARRRRCDGRPPSARADEQRRRAPADPDPAPPAPAHRRVVQPPRVERPAGPWVVATERLGRREPVRRCAPLPAAGLAAGRGGRSATVTRPPPPPLVWPRGLATAAGTRRSSRAGRGC